MKYNKAYNNNNNLLPIIIISKINDNIDLYIIIDNT